MRESPNTNNEESSSYKSLLILPLIYFNPGLSQSLFRDVFTVSIVQTWDKLMPYEAFWDLVCVKWSSSQKVITSCLVMGFSSGYPGEQRVWWPRQFSEGHSSRALHKDGCPQSGVQKRTAGRLHTIWVTMLCDFLLSPTGHFNFKVPFNTWVHWGPMSTRWKAYRAGLHSDWDFSVNQGLPSFSFRSQICTPREMNTCPHRNASFHAHGSIIRDGHKMQIPTDWWADK